MVRWTGGNPCNWLGLSEIRVPQQKSIVSHFPLKNTPRNLCINLVWDERSFQHISTSFRSIQMITMPLPHRDADAWRPDGPTTAHQVFHHGNAIAARWQRCFPLSSVQSPLINCESSASWGNEDAFRWRRAGIERRWMSPTANLDLKCWQYILDY